MLRLEDYEALTCAIRTYHVAAMEAERAGLNVAAIARAASAEQELARERGENAALRRLVADYEAAAAPPGRRLKIVRGGKGA